MRNFSSAIVALASAAVLSVAIVLAPMQVSQVCHSDNGLPDQNCTPGVVNPNVTQENIKTTICAHGWTATIRPPASYTTGLKVRQLRQYDYADKLPADFEEDHKVPLELGGSPTDPRNLWPEPWSGVQGAHAKDQVENALRAAVCAGTVTLAEAQRKITADWETAQ